MYTIKLEGLAFTGTLIEVTRKYLDLSQMLGGEDGWAHYISVTDSEGNVFAIDEWVEGARRLFGVSA